jgi:hypothetical protein
MTAYKWNVVQTEYRVSDKFIVTVHYTVKAVDGEFTASTYGTVGYVQKESVFTPFEDLTSEIVIGWVQESLGKEKIEQSLEKQIAEQRNPTNKI